MPSLLLGDAVSHYIYTRNNIQKHETEKNGEKIFISPNNKLEGVVNPFSLKHLVAFGTQCTCYIPPPRRSGKKQPGQVKSMEGVILGYVDDMNAYKVWDLKEKKVREVSFYFTVVSEGFFPFKNKKNWPEEEEKEPTSFFPTFETFLRGEEWKLFRFRRKKKKTPSGIRES